MKASFKPCPLPPGSAVWAYLRDSGGDTQDLASQRAYVLAYCEHHQLRLLRLFEDAAISGGSVVGRTEFELMMKLAKKGRQVEQVDGIIYWDTKRFARNQIDSQYYKADLRRQGYRLVSLSDDIPDNEFALVFESLFDWKAGKDREDISKDSKRGLAYIVGLKDDAGNYLGVMPGRPPTCFKGEPYDTGLQRNNGKARVVQRWVPDPATWETGQRAFKMRAEAASYKEIETAVGLFPNPKNPGSTYNAFFANEIYVGRLHYGGQVYENFVPSLTTPEIFEAVQAMKAEHRRKGSTSKGKHTAYLLSGLCFCEYCGSAMHGHTNVKNGHSWKYYVCANKKYGKCEQGKQFSAEKLEGAVIEQVCSRLLTIDYVEPLVDEINRLLANNDELEVKEASLVGKLRQVDKAINNLLDMAEGNPSAALMGRLSQREAERGALVKELGSVRQQIQSPGIQIDERFLLSYLAEQQEVLVNGSDKSKQFILQKVVKKIEVGRDNARLYCRFPLSDVSDNPLLLFMPPAGIEQKEWLLVGIFGVAVG